MIREELKNAEEQIEKYEKLIEQTKEELALAEKEEEEQHELFCSRVRAMEENGTVSYWAVLFNASDFTDLLSTLDDVGEIMENDQRIFDEMREIRKSIEEKKATLEQCLVEAEEQRKLLEEKRKELQAKLDESTALIQKISANKEQYLKLLRAEEAEAKSIDAQIRKLQAQLAANGNSAPATKGGYIWPVTTSKKISSPFGSRINPVTGRSETHKGVDIAGVFYSSNVIAAKAGTVIISQYGSSYGNYVVVSHGTGNTTLYAHLSKRSVKVGDVVKQGDVLGVTGSTGNSTGPHLHFEITEGGSRVDPLKYLTGYIKGWS
ncbi:MAG: peptidoglycan DD-metalloendopeptidase family protein [Oscillospiraceae bacterium]|nr:peptidoglycan DD-metalloendopeptidase family protein [Oscillospiraceae bacterium]